MQNGEASNNDLRLYRGGALRASDAIAKCSWGNE